MPNFQNFKVGYNYRMSTTRCKKCNYRSSFLLKCRCGNEYCTKDILPEVHKCTEMESFRTEARNKNQKILIDATQKEKVEWITR
jgi:predicted nucleic acid binding AN1-type Zn finger protein